MLKNFVEESCTGTGDLITLTGATVTKSIFNPEIVRDRAERASANAIVKGVSATVSADYAVRKVV